MEKILSIINNNDFSVEVDRLFKDLLAPQMAVKTNSPEAAAYIKQSKANIIIPFIYMNCYDEVKYLFENTDLVTKDNIIKLLDHAVANTQKGGDVSIQAYMMKYRMDNFPDIDNFDRLKL